MKKTTHIIHNWNNKCNFNHIRTQFIQPSLILVLSIIIVTATIAPDMTAYGLLSAVRVQPSFRLIHQPQEGCLLSSDKQFLFLRKNKYSTTMKRSMSTSTNIDIPSSSPDHRPRHQRIRIMGGGLAGLSMAYHILLSSKSQREEISQHSLYNITIYDIEHQIGTGGASAIAGGLLHPLSPRGKLVHWGLEGLAATNAMIDAAINATASTSTEPKDVDTIRLRDELYRIATSDEQKCQLRDIASIYPTIAESRNNIDENNVPGWKDDESSLTSVDERTPKDGLRLHNGCCVLHVPSYLRGVYKACEIMAQNTDSSIRWCQIKENRPLSGDMEHDYDATIYCYGSNMFQRSIHNNQLVDFTALLSMQENQSSSDGCSTGMSSFPVQLVRGQSMEVTLVHPLQHAMLCGKYISPLPTTSSDKQQHRALIGATHEFSTIPMTPEHVITDLQARTKEFAPFRYNDVDHPPPDTTETETTSSNCVLSVDRITCGYRVQSTRSDYGRRPIIGQLPTSSNNDWIFTGLSSRGLLYHALYGQMLAQAITQNDESILLDYCPDILWWKR